MRKQLDEAQNRCDAIENDSRLQHYLELDEIDARCLDQSALNQLRHVEHDIDDRIVQLRLILAEHEAIISYLTDQRLLPPTRDVERILEVLRSKHIRAWSGWEYIAENVRKTEMRSWLQCRPEVALGIVVCDAHYQQAQDTLKAEEMHLDTLVVIASQKATQHDAPAQMFVIGPTSDAYFDRDTGDRERLDRQQRQERVLKSKLP